jgi:hypothetical protein
MIILTAAMLVMGALVARDLTIMTSASAAVAGLDSTGLRTDPDSSSVDCGAMPGSAGQRRTARLLLLARRTPLIRP